MRTQPIIDVNGLTKHFGKFRALDGVNLTVTPGEVHGFLGPNGAGKSTTIRVLLGLLRSDGGTAQVLGSDPWKDVVSLHKRLAYVPGDVTLWPAMTGGEAIDLLGSLRGGLNTTRRAELIERFELDPTKRGRQYSKGNRQKVAIVAALSSDVELLILDEPTSGLDPLMENVFQDVVREAKGRGTSVLLSSHILSEVESLADTLSIIREGRIVRTGTLDQLQEKAQTIIRATLDREPPEGALELIHDIRVDGRHFVGATETAHAGAAVQALSAYGISTLTVEPPSLESLFLKLYEGTGKESQAHINAETAEK